MGSEVGNEVQVRMNVMLAGSGRTEESLCLIGMLDDKDDGDKDGGWSEAK